MIKFGKSRSRVAAAFVAIPVFLAGCESGGILSGGGKDSIVAPALDVLALDYERTNFTSSSRVSGKTALAQRDLRVSTATSGRLRHGATGPIPTEVRVDVKELVTSGNQVRMSGNLALRDLALGTIMAELPDFSASGSMPVVPASAGVQGLVFRGVEEEILAWLGGLECDTATRTCGKPKPKPLVEDEAAEDGEVPLTEDGDLELAELVGPRPVGLQKINTGGIDADQVIGAAQPVEAAAAPSAGNTLLGRTVAALGLLDRSGFWLQTPLVSSEQTGFIVNPANGKRIAATLIPKDGPVGGGSQLSLAAITELGADMTDLVNLEVYR